MSDSRVFNKLPLGIQRAIKGAGNPNASKIGNVDGITDREIAKAETVSPAAELGDNRTQIDTYFTSAPIGGRQTPQIYTGDRRWARVTLVLETGGPVAIGVTPKITPVLGGGGRLLITNVPYTVTIAKGTKIYVASTGVNRVGRTIEPVPWLEQITGTLLSTLSSIMQFATGK